MLVGPNNEGKSNVLTAINLALDILANWQQRRHFVSRTAIRAVSYRTAERVNYSWERDFPLSLQQDRPAGRSVITLELELTQKEFSDFQKTMGVNLNTNLKIKIGFGRQDVSYDILMKGRGKKRSIANANRLQSLFNLALYAIRCPHFGQQTMPRSLSQEHSNPSSGNSNLNRTIPRH